eukprot:5981622-Amphidinium_carterae.1
MGTKHVAISIPNKHCGMVGVRDEHGGDHRRHHDQSANSISTALLFTALEPSGAPSLNCRSYAHGGGLADVQCSGRNHNYP